jgi:hypothetical protein
MSALSGGFGCAATEGEDVPAPDLSASSFNFVAMHMSDGIVNAPTSVGFGVIVIVALGLCTWRAR